MQVAQSDHGLVSAMSGGLCLLALAAASSISLSLYIYRLANSKAEDADELYAIVGYEDRYKSPGDLDAKCKNLRVWEQCKMK